MLHKRTPAFFSNIKLRSSRSQMFFKIGVLENLTKLLGIIHFLIVILRWVLTFLYTSNLLGLTIQQYEIQVQNNTQTLKTSDTFLSKAWRCGQHVNINNKLKQTNKKKHCKRMGHKEIQRKSQDCLKVHCQVCYHFWQLKAL